MINHVITPTLRKQVMRLYDEGWHVANIASIAKVNADTVRQILKDNHIMM